MVEDSGVGLVERGGGRFGVWDGVRRFLGLGIQNFAAHIWSEMQAVKGAAMVVQALRRNRISIPRFEAPDTRCQLVAYPMVVSV